MDQQQILHQRVRKWIEQDPDPRTRAELEAIRSQNREDVLAELFSARLQFGTAGLRGELGAGPNRLNLAMVRWATAGLAYYLTETVSNAHERGVVIGYDARRQSCQFAEEAASVLTGAGFLVRMFSGLASTPLTAFAILETKAAAGLMITASHNPPQYNGMKVYWENGAQIIPPHDEGISAAIDKVGPLSLIPTIPMKTAIEERRLILFDQDIENRYLNTIDKLRVHSEYAKDLVAVYTPLHGVGGKLAHAALGQLGCKIVQVDSQAEPDGNFPTVNFPNPEEKGTLDLAIALAQEIRADLVLANDPDADRFAAAVPTPGLLALSPQIGTVSEEKNKASANQQGYLQLSGDQIGVLLAYYLLTEKPCAKEDEKKRLVISTIVSSSLLSIMARELNVNYSETLTGFKWLANKAQALFAERGLYFVMAYEEALGYCIGSAVRDKDGISAAAVFADLAGFCKSRGKTILEYLEEIYRRFGFFNNVQYNFVLPGSSGTARIKNMMSKLRSDTPTTIGEWSVLASTDYANGIYRSNDEKATDLPRSDVLRFDLGNYQSDESMRGPPNTSGQAPIGRIIARPSGTEPKIKFYFELRETLSPEESLAKAQQRANIKMEKLIQSFLELVGK